MSEAPKVKVKDPHAWGAFFESEFQNLKLKTGILQYEKFMASEGGSNEMKVLCGLMVKECQIPPYNQIEKQILQRVISAAVVDDKDFIGFNVKFIRKTLNQWWYLSGWKLVEKMQKEKEAEAERNKPVPTVNPHENAQDLVKRYLDSLVKPVPKLSPEEIQKEGQERKKEKALSATYNIDYQRNLQINLQHEINRLAIEGYSHLKPVEKVDFKVFVIDGIYKVNCASMQDAEEIYRVAKERLKL